MIRASLSGNNPSTRSGQNLGITGVFGFTHGTGYLDGNGFIHYTPEANYFGAANDAIFEIRRAA